MQHPGSRFPAAIWVQPPGAHRLPWTPTIGHQQTRTSPAHCLALRGSSCSNPIARSALSRWSGQYVVAAGPGATRPTTPYKACRYLASASSPACSRWGDTPRPGASPGAPVSRRRRMRLGTIHECQGEGHDRSHGVGLSRATRGGRRGCSGRARRRRSAGGSSWRPSICPSGPSGPGRRGPSACAGSCRRSAAAHRLRGTAR